MPDFAYINARVRAMRSRLLPAAQLEDLLGSSSMAAFLQALSGTPYGGDLQEALLRYQDLRAVDEAVARNFQRTTQAILSFADGRPRALIEAVLLRWDLANLRVILRGKHAARPAEEVVQALLPAGTLRELVLKEMAGQPDMAALAGTLEVVGHPLTAAMADGVAEYAATQDLLAFELRLERAYMDHLRRLLRGRDANRRAVREILATEVDGTNVKTALKLAAAGSLDEEQRGRCFISGGSLVDAPLFLALSDAGTQAAAWRDLRRRGFPIRTLPDDLVAFERTLDLSLTRALAAHYRGDPLGIDIVVGYLAKKSAEVANLRLIARGHLLGLPRDAVRRELVLV